MSVMVVVAQHESTGSLIVLPGSICLYNVDGCFIPLMITLQWDEDQRQGGRRTFAVFEASSQRAAVRAVCPRDAHLPRQRLEVAPQRHQLRQALSPSGRSERQASRQFSRDLDGRGSAYVWCCEARRAVPASVDPDIG